MTQQLELKMKKMQRSSKKYRLDSTAKSIQNNDDNESIFNGRYSASENNTG